MHLRDGDGLGQRYDESLREGRVGDPHMGQAVADGAQRGQPRQAGRDFIEVDFGAADFAHHPGHRPAFAVHLARAGGAELAAEFLLAAGVQVVVLQIAVQERRVCGVDADFKSLQPVATPQALEGKAVTGRRGKAVEGRQFGRRAVFRAEVGKDDAGHHAQRVAALAHALAQGAAHRFGRRFQALTAGRELPAVEGAADAVAFMPRKGQVGAPVRAVAVQQPEGAGSVTEEHQVLAQQAHRLQRPIGHARVQPRVEFVQQCSRLPVTAQQVAARRAGACAGDEFVLGSVHDAAQSRRRSRVKQARQIRGRSRAGAAAGV